MMEGDLDINHIPNNFPADEYTQPTSTNDLETLNYDSNDQYLGSHHRNIWEYDAQNSSSEKACPLYFTYSNIPDSSTYHRFMRTVYNTQLKMVLHEIQLIFDEVYRLNIVELMMRFDGSHLVKNLFETGNADQRRKIMSTIVLDMVNFLKIYCHDIGNQALKRLFSCMTRDEESLIASFLNDNMIKLTKVDNGCVFLNCCVDCLSPLHAESVIRAVSENCNELTMDKGGCILLQTFLNDVDRYDMEELIGKIISKAFPLSLDKYGNYVVQKVIDKSSTQWKTILHDRIFSGRYQYLSRHEFGSRIVEKMLFATQDNERVFEHIIQELMMKIFEISSNNFGNYVIQSALTLSKGSDYRSLVQKIRCHEDDLRNSMYGNTVLIMIDKTSWKTAHPKRVMKADQAQPQPTSRPLSASSSRTISVPRLVSLSKPTAPPVVLDERVNQILTNTSSSSRSSVKFAGKV